MTLRLVDTRRAAGQIRRRGAIVTLAAITIAAVMTLAALGIADRQTGNARLAAQAIADAVGTAQSIFDRDRLLLNRMTDAAAAGSPDGSALPVLPPDLRAAALFDPAGAPLASASIGLDAGMLAALGDTVTRAVAFHPGAALLVVSGIGDDGTALAALAQPWSGDDGFSGGIAVVAFDRAGLAALDRLTARRIDIVTADGTPLFAAGTDAAAAGARLATIPGMPLALRYRPRPDHAAQLLRAAAPFALIALLALAAALGLAIILIRRDRAARREIARLAAAERKLVDELTATAAAAGRTDETNRAKSRFFAEVTHELRTPLNAILGFSETIRQEMFGPVANTRYLEYAGLIHDAGSHLLSLINDLLDNARIEAGKMEIAPIRVSAAAAARSALDLVELLAEQRKVTLAANGLAICPDLNVDPRAMKQVLVNLLSNAIKYTPAGGRIEMRFAARSEGGVAIEVADTGTGMSTEEVLYAFEPFGRPGADQMRRQPGTGLGLSLARSLVRLHGGDLTLASRLDAGTTATVTLPASAAFGATGAASAPAKSEADTAAARAA
jgi:signal transduction histidine kinase